MKRLKPSTQYRKDLKRIRNNPKKAEALLKVLHILEQELEIPTEYNPHPLTGDYNGCMECHIQGDFLLIWIDEEAHEIDLVRLGSHVRIIRKRIEAIMSHFGPTRFVLRHPYPRRYATTPSGSRTSCVSDRYPRRGGGLHGPDAGDRYRQRACNVRRITGTHQDEKNTGPA